MYHVPFLWRMNAEGDRELYSFFHDTLSRVKKNVKILVPTWVNFLIKINTRLSLSLSLFTCHSQVGVNCDTSYRTPWISPFYWFTYYVFKVSLCPFNLRKNVDLN